MLKFDINTFSSIDNQLETAMLIKNDDYSCHRRFSCRKCPLYMLYKEHGRSMDGCGVGDINNSGHDIYKRRVDLIDSFLKYVNWKNEIAIVDDIHQKFDVEKYNNR